ncbi:hypothetical protein L1987_42471 [Smallanthus sonchifolius]|uniref:Uncharacterized protein n=1 Tax=Smallanthus sonchifolius TaxID=185202 RepID=A0ACB9GJX4_9ASTR|nr:hypothetical protein L1987_42471 [Smallanthus sonchifolius]
MSGDNSVPVYYDPNHPIKQESPEYHPLGSRMNPISLPFYNGDPFAILPNNNSPEYHPQSYNSSSQWMEAGSNFSNLNTNNQQLQGNNEAESSYIQQNKSIEEDTSEESHQYEPISENPEDYPFNNPISNKYFQAPPEYQNAYNDIMMGLRKQPPKYGYAERKGKCPSFIRKFSLANYHERKTNETTIENNEETESSTFRSLREIGNPSVPYNPSISFHSAPTAGSYNVTPIYSRNFHEGYTDMPYENNHEKEERANSNIPYIPYYETIPIPASHINENASGREREQKLMRRIAELEREKAEVETQNALLIQALEEKNFRNF